MEKTTVNLADAKARLSELTERAAAGEEIVITKRGRPVGRLVAPEVPRIPVDLEALRRLTARLTTQVPRQAEPAGEFMRAVRDRERY